MSRFRAFESTGTCRDCGWHGGLDAGLCIFCQNLPEVVDEPATVLGEVPLIGGACTYCGADVDGEWCSDCWLEITAVTEPRWRNR